MNPQEITTFGAGVMALALVLWFLKGVLNAYTKRLENGAQGEGTLAQALQSQLNDLYERNKQLTDRYDAAMQKSLSLSITHGQEMMAAVNDVRREYHEGMIRVHTILDETKRDLQLCQVRHEECDERVAALEAKIDQVVGDRHSHRRQADSTLG